MENVEINIEHVLAMYKDAYTNACKRIVEYEAAITQLQEQNRDLSWQLTRKTVEDKEPAQ